MVSHISLGLAAVGSASGAFALEVEEREQERVSVSSFSINYLLFRQKYQQTQKGKMGIALNCDWMEPGSDSGTPNL